MARRANATAGAQDRRRVGDASDRRKGARRRDDESAATRDGLRHAASLATLDKLNRGVFLLDPDGMVTFANRAAESMVARDDGLWLRKHRLQFRCEHTQAALESFLADCSRGAGEGLVLCNGGSARACRYRVLVSPLEPRSAHIGRVAGYCVFIYEPNGGQKPLSGKLLQNLYRLTAAEARLANELFRGRPLAQAAAACGIRMNTAKSMLKQIFSKCAVHSRSELLLLLSLGPRTL